MVKETITYVDYNGVERTEDFYFNLSKAEVMEMEMSITGGMTELIHRIVSTQDIPAIMKIFKDLLLKAYGQKSADGRGFIKVDKDGHRLADDFAQTEAYSQLFVELATNADKAAKFINGIIPSDKNSVVASAPVS